jgi:hypothetical protein
VAISRAMGVGGGGNGCRRMVEVVVVLVVYLRSGPTTRQKASESAAVMIARTRRSEKMPGPASWQRRLCRSRTMSVGRCMGGCCCCGSSCCMGVDVAAAIVAWQGSSSLAGDVTVQGRR